MYLGNKQGIIMFKTLGLSFLMLLSLNALALTEAGFSENYETKVRPFYNQMFKGVIRNPQGMMIRFVYQQKSTAKKTVVVLPGRTESTLDYAEFLHDLDSPDINLFALDHQGQGASDRHLKNPQKGHVNHFNDYANDVKWWISSFVSPLSVGKEMLLVSHSMGGAISAIYLADNANHPFKKVVLMAPMMEINTKPYNELVARSLTATMVTFGKGKDYKPGGKDFSVEKDTFAANDTTQSEVRFNKDHENSINFPELIVADPTNRWVHESLVATSDIDKKAKKIKIPILMFQAGKDLIVKPGRQTKFCKAAPDCKMIQFPEAYHAIFREKDVIRNPALFAIKDFLKI